MQSTREPSIEDLRRESERARQELATTVGDLREKVGGTAQELKTLVSPAHIKQEIKNYVRDERESLVRSVQRRAKENPLQAAAVGAALAYPALGLLRAIPAPLWLIGAGLFLTSSRGRSSVNQIKDKVDEALQEAMQQGTEKVSDLTEKVSDYAASIKSDLDDRIAGARYGAEDAVDTVVSGVDAVTGKARAAYRGAAETFTATAAGSADKAAATAASLSAAATDTVAGMKDRAASIGTSSRNTVTDFINQNPLLVAGIGAAVGAFIAASLPPSRAENQLFGAGSKALKEKAREAAAQGVEKAGEFAADAVGGVAAAAAREGLDGAGLKRALNSVTDGVRAVADRGLDTALAPTQPNQHYTNERNAS